MNNKLPRLIILFSFLFFILSFLSFTQSRPPRPQSFLTEDPTIEWYTQKKAESRLKSNWTDNSLWPKPHVISGGNNNIPIFPRSFSIRPLTPSGDILNKAINRYFDYFFPWDPATTQPNGILPTLDVKILQPYNESLYFEVDESYNITITAGNSPSALLTANTVFGVLRGLETFSQLVQYNWRTQEYQVSDFAIQDWPRFPYRGVMIDNARRFMTVSTIKMVIKAMSFYKLNTLHLHLTDTDGWPIEIPGYPLLTQVGAYWPVQNNVYSVSDMKEVVQFALERGIRVVPEIDTPGHSFTMCLAYPEYCAYYINNNQTVPGLYPDPSNPKTWQFLTNIWKELVQIFPSDWYHIGSDEMWFGQWQVSPAVLAFMKKMGWTDISEVFYYYQRHMIDIMRQLGKKTMGWYPGLDSFPNNFNGTFYEYPDVMVNIWTGGTFPFHQWASDASNLALGGLHFIITRPYWVVVPQRDGQDNNQNAPSWQLMYGSDPFNFTAPENLKMEYCKGGELTAWDDTAITDSGNLPVALTPYLGAVAENWWSEIANGSLPNYQRYTVQRCRTLVRGVPSNPLSGSDLHPFRCVEEYNYPGPI